MTLNDSSLLPYRMELVEDPDEGGYVASYPDLPGCITCRQKMHATQRGLGWKRRSKMESRSQSRRNL